MVQCLYPYTYIYIHNVFAYLQVLKLLLEHGVNPNSLEPKHKAPLLNCACERGCKDVVSLLLSRGADPTLADCRGNVSLWHAARAGSLDIVEQLIKE